MSFSNFIKKMILEDGGIYDPKQKGKYKPLPPDPEDDDYDPREDYSDEEKWFQGTDYLHKGHGLNHDYPKAKIGKSRRGLSIKSPEDIFSNDVTHDNMSDDELYQTLQAKLYSGEELTDDEKMWLSMLSRKHVRHGVFNKKPLSDDPLD